MLTPNRSPSHRDNQGPWLWASAFAAMTVEILSARPHIEHVAVLRAHFLDPACAGRGINACALAVDRDQRGLDVGLHPAAIAADVDDRALLDQAPDLLLLCRDQ